MMKTLNNLIAIYVKRVHVRHLEWKVKHLKRKAVRIELKILYEHMMCLCIDTNRSIDTLSIDDVTELGKDIAVVYNKIDTLKRCYVINDAAKYYINNMNMLKELMKVEELK